MRSTIQSLSSEVTLEKVRVLISRDEIAQRVVEMGAAITRDFAGEKVVLLGVLKGSAIFLADLARHITLDVTFDFISVSSYGNTKQQSGEVKLLKDPDQPLAGQNVILVEDILDTGVTLTFLRDLIQTRQPKKLKIAALLDKVSRHLMPIKGDYVGFEIPDEFVVGYGMDFAERYRNLPDVCVLESDAAAE